MSRTFQITTIDQDELELVIKNSLIEALKSWQPPQAEPQNSKEYLTRKEVGMLLRLSLPTIDDYIKRGIFKAVRFKGRVRVLKSSVDEAAVEIKSIRYRRK